MQKHKKNASHGGLARSLQEGLALSQSGKSPSCIHQHSLHLLYNYAPHFGGDGITPMHRARWCGNKQQRNMTATEKSSKTSSCPKGR